jgi:hypothetical protein
MSEPSSKKERPWLYFMVFIVFCNTIDNCSNQRSINEKLNEIQKELENCKK